MLFQVLVFEIIDLADVVVVMSEPVIKKQTGGHRAEFGVLVHIVPAWGNEGIQVSYRAAALCQEIVQYSFIVLLHVVVAGYPPNGVYGFQWLLRLSKYCLHAGTEVVHLFIIQVADYLQQAPFFRLGLPFYQCIFYTMQHVPENFLVAVQLYCYVNVIHNEGKL